MALFCTVCTYAPPLEAELAELIVNDVYNSPGALTLFCKVSVEEGHNMGAGAAAVRTEASV